MARLFINDGRLFQVGAGPEFNSYRVFPREAESEVLRLALHGLGELAAEVQAPAPI
jgi:hypothetical protein